MKDLPLKDLITFLEAEEEKAMSVLGKDKNFKELGQKRARAFWQIRQLIEQEPKIHYLCMEKYIKNKKEKMSDERKKWLIKHIDHVFTECRGHIEHSNSDCLNCLEGAETCYQVHEEIKRLIIQSKPEIDEKYVEEKAREFQFHKQLFYKVIMDSDSLRTIKEFITQIINDARGLQVPVVKIKAPIVKPSENEEFPYECCEKCDRLIKQFACKGVANAIECLYLLSKMKIKKKGGD